MLQVKIKFRLKFFNQGWFSISFVSQPYISWINIFLMFSPGLKFTITFLSQQILVFIFKDAMKG